MKPPTTTRPTWTDPVAYARSEATSALQCGEGLTPTCVVFEGEEPTLYLRARPLLAGEGNEQQLLREVTTFLARFRPRRALLLHGGRLWDHDVPEADKPATPYEPVACVSWIDCPQAGPQRCGGVLLRYRRDDEGRVHWTDRLPVPDGGVGGDLLRQATDDGAAAVTEGVTAAEACYVLSRWGHVIGVAPAWRAAYGLDRPLDPRKVRPEDRRRAERYRSSHRAARRATSARGEATA